MNLKNFLQCNVMLSSVMLSLSKHIGTHRFVWNETPDETPPAPAGAPAAAARTPEDAAAAAARMKAEGTTRRASGQTDPEGEQAAAAALDQLGGGAASGQAPAASAETPEQNETLPSFAEITKILTENHPDEFRAVQAETDPARIEQKLRVLFAALTPGEKETFERLDVALLAVTPKEQADFKNTYKKGDNTLDLAAIGKELKEKKFTTKKYLIFLSLVGDAEIDELVKQNVFSTADAIFWKDFLTSVKVKIETKRKLDRFDELVKDNKYAAAYKKFLENPDGKTPDKLKEEFFAVFTDQQDREIVEWAINSQISTFEKAYVLRNKLKDTKLSDEDIGRKLAAGELNFREAQIALALNHEQSAAEESKIPDSIKGLGIMGALEKLIELLTKLAEKLSISIEKAFGKKEGPGERPHFAKSPLGVDEKGADKKFKLKKPYESGKGVAFEAAQGAQIFSVEPGKVTVSDNVVTIIMAGGRIEYRNVKAEYGINGTTIEAGKPIGKAGEQGFVELHAFDDKNKEVNPTALLEPYLTEETVAQTPATPAPAPPAAPSPTTTPPAPAPKPPIPPPPPAAAQG